MSSSFDSRIKIYPVYNSVNEGTAGIARALRISSASTESGVRSAKPNSKGHQ